MTDPSIDDNQTEPSAGASVDGSGRRLPSGLGLVLAVVAVIAFVGLLFAGARSEDDAESPTALGEFTFQTVDGGTVTLADFEGTPLVVNYFAAWCAPCRAEMPEFEEVSQETAGEVVFIGVSRDNLTDSWLQLVDETGVTFQTVYEGNVRGSFEFLDAAAMPTTVFIGADGSVERTWSGALTDDKLRELIAEHLT